MFLNLRDSLSLSEYLFDKCDITNQYSVFLCVWLLMIKILADGKEGRSEMGCKLKSKIYFFNDHLLKKIDTDCLEF